MNIPRIWESFVEYIKDYVIFPLTEINVIDIIDILLLSFLIYTVYKFIRDRHVGRIALGLGAIVLIYIISDLFHMTAISSILKNFYVVGIMVICIIFQPELRAALEEVGSTSIHIKNIRNKKTAEDEEILSVVEEISAAAFELSAKREGALIVIERSSRLRSQLTEGVPMDAKVSRQLLCNVFVNRSPLHDGAVVIRGTRIISASCKSKTISESNDPMIKGLGTRHRAALRISEISDAVVVVVSEETGNISVANNNILKRDYQNIGKGEKHKSNDLRNDLFLLLTGKSADDGAPAIINTQDINISDVKLDSALDSVEGFDEVTPAATEADLSRKEGNENEAE